MAVENTFRAARGARGVEDHPYRVRVEDGHLIDVRTLLEQGRVRGVAAVLTSHHDDFGRRVHLRSDTIGHREIVMLPELVWHE